MCRFLLHHPINSEYLEDSYYSECLTTCNVDKLLSSLTVIGQLLEFLSVAHPMFVTRQKWHVIRETLHWMSHPSHSPCERMEPRRGTEDIYPVPRPSKVGRSLLFLRSLCSAASANMGLKCENSAEKGQRSVSQDRPGASEDLKALFFSPTKGGLYVQCAEQAVVGLL